MYAHETAWSIQDWWVILISSGVSRLPAFIHSLSGWSSARVKRGEPHFGQNSRVIRLPLSAVLVYPATFPETVRPPTSTPTPTVNGPPVALRQSSQWQYDAVGDAPVHSYCTAPQRHPPFKVTALLILHLPFLEVLNEIIAQPRMPSRPFLIKRAVPAWLSS